MPDDSPDPELEEDLLDRIDRIGYLLRSVYGGVFVDPADLSREVLESLIRGIREDIDTIYGLFMPFINMSERRWKRIANEAREKG